MPEFKGKIISASLRAGKKSMKFKQVPEGAFVYLDGVQLDPIDTIIELQLQ